MSRWHWTAVALLFGGVGCSARVACEEPSDGTGGLALDSAPIGGSLLATSAAEGKAWRLRATLRGLPELWQGDSAILGGTVSLAVSVAYDASPTGGDGSTEMPSVRVAFEGLANERWATNGATQQTPKFAGPAASRFTRPIFDTCFSDQQQNCCAYGERECSLPITLRLERVEGAPFPTIVADWSAQLSTRVSTCPVGHSAPTLSLELVDE